MALIDELNTLADLRQRGVLTEQEFANAKARLLAGSAPDSLGSGAAAGLNSLRRSRNDRWIAGVCGGMARATGIESWVWRFLLVVMVLWGGAGVLLYLLLWIFIPSE